MRTKWQIYFSRPNKRNIFIGTQVFLVVTLLSFLHFLSFNEARPGFHFNDPILRLFHPIPLSQYIFFVNYVLSVYGLITAFQEPKLFIKLAQAYSLLILMRMLTLYLVPLEPPDLIIPLKDSILQSSFYAGRANLKDLFFSGHTSTLFLFAFCLQNKGQKLLFTAGGITVGVLLVLQQVHYSIDVIAAPVFSYAAVKLQQKINIQ